MAKGKSSFSKKAFFVFIPVAAIFAIGVFSATAQKIKPDSKNASCSATDLTGIYIPDERMAIFDGKKIEAPLLASADTSQVLGVASPEERWIEVDLSDQTLKAWDGSELFLETKISSGLPWTPTPQGEFRIWIKLKATKMEGGSGRYYYYLPNVPFTMFFSGADVPAYKGYGLHGTYWHDDFGTPRSHGCVNLPTPIAEKIFYWTTPTVPDGKSVVYASDESPGTRIVIHE